MKKLKPSKLLILSAGVFAFLGITLTNGVDAASYDRSIGSMMARRHNATRPSRQDRAKQLTIGRRAEPAVKTPKSTESSGNHVSTIPFTAPAPISLSLGELFDATDKDGSIFPGGPCKNCHNTGPIFDTGPCERCYNTGPLIDTGTCERCYNKGPLIDTGSCERCYEGGPLVDTGPCEKCKEPEPIIQEPVCPACVAPQLVNYTLSYNDFVTQAATRDCCSFAPLYLEHVDFNLKADENTTPNKLGNYRFRIFGCRRYDREAVLNHGRIFEKDMHFIDIFEHETSDCYTIIKKPDDLCLQTTPSPLPEYVLTAEITDFFMNICDGHDWEESKSKETRSGRSEMTVTWKLSNVSKTKVVWEGKTTGYADINIGQENGEIALVEAAFADAVRNLQTAYGFERQLATRMTPEELVFEREALIKQEIAADPAKCKYAEELHRQKQCEITRPEINIMECPAIEQVFVAEPSPCEVESAPCPVAIEENSGTISEHDIIQTCINEDGGIIANGNCAIVDDTWVDANVKAFDSLCITARAPYSVLDAQNLYKVRASVVEISNEAGKKGAGLIVSDNFVLTSADMSGNKDSACQIRTINGKTLTGRVVRVNPSKNTALIMLDEKTQYTPLSLNLELPKIDQNGFMTLGLLDVDVFDNGSENYIDNSGRILGYRYSEEKGSEIIVDTNVQDIAIGSVLVDAHGSVTGLAHTGQKTDSGKDLFLPTETALRSLGLTICNYVYEEPSPWQQTVYKPVTQLIQTVQKAPEEMKASDKK